MTLVDSFRLDVPSSWQQMPLDLPSLRASLMERGSEGWTALSVVERRRVEVFLQRMLSDIQMVEARYVAVYSEADSSEDGGALLAAVVVSVLDQASIGTSLPLTPAVIQAAMTMDAGDAESPVFVETRTTNLEAPIVVKLPSVEAVRVRRLVEMFVDSREALAIASDTYFVPVPEEFDQAVVIQFSTPNIAEASVFSELFEAIAATVRFYREGEETTL